jgi:hypothetical protein
MPSLTDAGDLTVVELLWLRGERRRGGRFLSGGLFRVRSQASDRFRSAHGGGRRGEGVGGSPVVTFELETCRGVGVGGGPPARMSGKPVCVSKLCYHGSPCSA